VRAARGIGRPSWDGWAERSSAGALVCRIISGPQAAARGDPPQGVALWGPPVTLVDHATGARLGAIEESSSCPRRAGRRPRSGWNRLHRTVGRSQPSTQRIGAELWRLLCPWRAKPSTYGPCRELWRVVAPGASSPPLRAVRPNRAQPPTLPHQPLRGSSPHQPRREPPTPRKRDDRPATPTPPQRARSPSPRRRGTTRSDGLTRRRLLGRQLTPLRELPLADRIAHLHDAAALAARAAAQAK
jgi:hypothetical protein